MFFIFALVVLSTSIFIIFLDEFMRLFERFFALPGVKLLFPLLLASTIVEIFEHLERWILIHLKILMHQTVHQLATFLPFKTGAEVFTEIVFLFLWVSIPIWFLFWHTKQKVEWHPQTYQWIIGVTIWVIAAVLLSIVL